MKDYKIGRVVSYFRTPRVECLGFNRERKRFLRPYPDITLYDNDVVIGYVKEYSGELQIIYKTQYNKDLNKENVARVVCDFINKNQEILLNDYYEDISIYDLDKKTRIRSIVVARQLSQFIYKLITCKSLREVGKIYGGKDHSTVIYSIQTMLTEMSSNKGFVTVLPDIIDRVINYDNKTIKGINQHNFNTCTI